MDADGLGIAVGAGIALVLVLWILVKLLTGGQPKDDFLQHEVTRFAAKDTIPTSSGGGFVSKLIKFLVIMAVGVILAVAAAFIASGGGL